MHRDHAVLHSILPDTEALFNRIQLLLPSSTGRLMTLNATQGLISETLRPSVGITGKQQYQDSVCSCTTGMIKHVQGMPLFILLPMPVRECIGSAQGE